MKLALIALALVGASLVSSQEKPACYIEIDVAYKGSKAGLDSLDIGKKANEEKCRNWCRYLKIFFIFYDVGHNYRVYNYLRLKLFYVGLGTAKGTMDK